jgi:hypothetical protein
MGFSRVVVDALTTLSQKLPRNDPHADSPSHFESGGIYDPKPQVLRPPHLCRSCGKPLKEQRNRTCGVCAIAMSRENLLEAAKLGRVATHTAEAEALRGATQRRQAAALKAWNPAERPDWLTEKMYREEVHPRLARITVPAISAALGVSEPYATDIRAGRRVPHTRHWQALAQLAGVTGVEAI